MSTLSPFPKEDAVTGRDGKLLPPWWRWFNDLMNQANPNDARIAALEAQDTSILATLASMLATLTGYATTFTTATLTAVSGLFTTLAATSLSVSAVTFPAVQVPSTDANTLDDYEEGTWTPTLRFGGASVGLTYTTQVGAYVKVGRIVTVTCRMDLSAKGSSTGSATVAGLPFAAADATASFNGAALAGGMSGLTSPITPRVVANASVLDLFDWGAAGVVAIDDANFTNGSVVVITQTYLAGA